MQTFLPHSNFKSCAIVLDDKRLYKQILNVLEQRMKRHYKYEAEMHNASKEHRIAWENHPAVLMWEGHSATLRHYQLSMLDEWLQRRWNAHLSANQMDEAIGEMLTQGNPEWLGKEELHRSHQAMLYWKDRKHYAQYMKQYLQLVEEGCSENQKPEYYWPTKQR